MRALERLCVRLCTRARVCALLRACMRLCVHACTPALVRSCVTDGCHGRFASSVCSPTPVFEATDVLLAISEAPVLPSEVPEAPVAPSAVPKALVVLLVLSEDPGRSISRV